MAWPKNVVQAGTHSRAGDSVTATDRLKDAQRVEPWLAALLQAEHLSLLVGSGLTTAVAVRAKVPHVSMNPGRFSCVHATAIAKVATDSANRMGRGAPNIEDEIRAARELLGGLHILSQSDEEGDDTALWAARMHEEWASALRDCLSSFLGSVLETERAIGTSLDAPGPEGDQLRRDLGSFLLSFASRTATRERLHIFTTNYDRLIEYGCDLLGLRVLDRFVGRMTPVFRASRLGVDMHYNPPGIRGEPRYLEGVVRFTKLHGSVDWRHSPASSTRSQVERASVPFGASPKHPDLPADVLDGLLIYPNPAKDIETLEFPYAELFRDFAAAVCQPNSALVTYGYGFGDDHINRVIRDMLTIPSTHLAIISYDGANDRIERFVGTIGRQEQMTLLIGPEYGDLEQLVTHYLPKPAIDRTTLRMVELINQRLIRNEDNPKEPS